MSGAANRVASFRFAEAKANTSWGNPHWLWWLQYTKSGRTCNRPCEPDPADANRDICEVTVGSKTEKEECVKIANINTVREMLSRERENNVKIFPAIIGELNELMGQFSGVESFHNDLVRKRGEYMKKVAEIYKEKAFLQEIIKTLQSNADALDKWKDSISKLKGLLEDLTKNYEVPEGDCTGFPGYEKELEGDGLVGRYFNNLRFEGEPKRQVDSRIKFFWANEPPVKDYNPNNFTIEWEGFLRPPKTGDYNFYCESDDGCTVSLNDTVIIRDNLPDGPMSDLLEPKKKYMEMQIANGNWDEFIKPPGLKDPDRFPRTPKTASPVPLVGGDYVPIKIRMLHSVHNSLFEDGNSYVYLYWESDDIKKQVIPGAYLYTKIKYNPLKPTDYDSQMFLLDILQENDSAFMDDESFKVKYIPAEFKGLQCLKTRAQYKHDKVKFNVSMPLRVYVAFDAAVNPPVDSTWKTSDYEMAFLKVNSNDLPKLEMGQLVTATDDVSLLIMYKDFPEGEISFETAVGEPIKMIVFISPGPKGPELTCGGAEIELSKDQDYFFGCEESSKEGEDGCQAGLGEGFWKASGNIQETMDITFKSMVKPTKIVVKQPTPMENMSRKIQVYLSESQFETLDLIQDEEKQTFQLKQTRSLDKIKLAIESTFGGKNAGGQFKIMGVRCEDPFAKEKADKKAKSEAMGLTEVLKSQAKSCDDTLDNMESEKIKISCLQDCAVKESGFTLVSEGCYSMDSSPCVAAKDFYKGKDEETQKEFGIVRVTNRVKVNGSVPPYCFKFDNGLCKVAKKFKANEEVDVLDEKECFIRAKVTKVEGDAVKVSYNQEDRSYPMANVFKCGERMPFKPCDSPSTTPIKIKFVPGTCLEDIKKKNIGQFEYDTGALAKQGKVFYYGWSKGPKMSQIDNITNEDDKQKLYLGTAAEMEKGNDWFIQVPNGKYDVKVTLKIVNNKENQAKFKGKDKMDFMINEVEINTSPMHIENEIIHDKPNINVTTGEIRLKWKHGVVSIVSIEIIAQNDAPDPGAVRKEVSKNTYSGGDCMSGNTKNCLFDESQLTKIKCDGVMVKIGAKATNKEAACMYKCVDSSFDTQEDCTKFLPETLTCSKKGASYSIS